MTKSMKLCLCGGLCASALIVGVLSAPAARAASDNVVSQALSGSAGAAGSVSDAVGRPSLTGVVTKSPVAVAQLGVINTQNGLADAASTAGAAGNLLSGGTITSGDVGQLVKNIDPTGGALIKNWDSLTDISSLADVKNLGVSFLKDLSPELKSLMSLNISELANLGSIDSIVGSVSGYPVSYVDLTGQDILTASSAVAHGVAQEQQYSSEVDYSASIGDYGVMDGRFGECSFDGTDYSGAINAWLSGPGLKNEGMYRNLYLDTECWVTIGVGSVLFEYSSKGNWEGYKNYFLTFDYVDWNGNPLSKEVQEADLRVFFDMEQKCRAGDATLRAQVKKNGGGSSLWKSKLHGQITEQSAVNAAFREICDHHVKSWHTIWKQLGKSFADLPLQHQMAVIDISFQGGPGTIRGCSSCSMSTSYSRPFKSALVSGSCSGAVSAFSGAPLCTRYSNRCGERKRLLNAPCGGAG
ncbi:MAG: hypothetical protein ACI4QM_02475 [Alphaproteobacteria bacterium]